MFGKKDTSDKRVRVPEHSKILWGFFVVFMIYTLALLFVFGWLFLNSFKTVDEYYASIYAFPKNILNFENYKMVFTTETSSGSLSSMFFNSIIICAILPTVGCVTTTLAAYVLAKYKFKGSKFIYFLYILPMMFSLAGTQATVYKILDDLRVIDTLGSLVIMSAGAGGMNFLLVYGTFKNVSDTYMEAAAIDGAGHIRTFVQIMLPHALGIIGTLWMFGFIGTWNDYTSIKLFLPSMPTVAVGLETIHSVFVANDGWYPTYYAGLIISLLPVVILFMIFQKQIMKLSLGGGIKG